MILSLFARVMRMVSMFSRFRYLRTPVLSEMEMHIHHDIMIQAFPLRTAWLDRPLNGGDRGNFIAVGSMQPSIEIWDLDVLEEVQPCKVLGGEPEKKKKGKKVCSAFRIN